MASIWTRKKFKTKSTIDDVVKIYNSIDVGFGPNVRTRTVGVNAYFIPIITNWPLPTPNYVQVNTTDNMEY